MFAVLVLASLNILPLPGSPALFGVGFALLPFFWAANVWLFWPHFWHGHDAVLKRCAFVCLAMF